MWKLQLKLQENLQFMVNWHKKGVQIPHALDTHVENRVGNGVPVKIE